jgi:hypothetical protein
MLGDYVIYPQQNPAVKMPPRKCCYTTLNKWIRLRYLREEEEK